LLPISEELSCPVANFSNEQIRDVIARYNQKHSSQNTVSTSENPHLVRLVNATTNLHVEI